MAPPPPPPPPPPRGVLALLPLLLLLSHRLPSARGFQRSFLEVIVPEKIGSPKQQFTDRVMFSLRLGERDHVLILSQQSFLIKDFRVYSVKSDGSEMSYSPSIKNCFYQGYVMGSVDSLVMVDTCSGFTGIIQIGNVSYGIEPVDFTSSFRHLVYQIDYSDVEFNISKKDYFIKFSNDMMERANPNIPVNFTTMRYMEVHVVVSRTLFNHLGSNEELVMRKVMQLFCFINAMFYKLNLRVILSSLEFWKQGDELPVRSDPSQLLDKFAEWKSTHLTLRPHDVALLLIYSDTTEFLGATFEKKLCWNPSSVGIAVYQNWMTQESFSVVVTQLLGFTMGIAFDDNRECVCPRVTCVMVTSAVHSSGVKSFSSCSISDYQKYLGHKTAQCLLNKPRDISHKAPQCGNRVVEEGEQCDCGTPEECKSNPCCNPDCALKKGKECAHGECCLLRSCRLKAKGTPCRENPSEECDLKEYCNGSSPVCTEDFYVEDGQYCGQKSGICMKGVCQSPDVLCRKLFGKESKSGSPQCYEEINSQKDRMGNCGSTLNGYISCQWADLRCGRVVCEYRSKKPFVSEIATVVYVKVQNRMCATLDYMRYPKEKDFLLVPDGSSCGNNKICLRQKCVNKSFLKVTCDSEKNCNGKGHCNNKGHCHCNPGWAPPTCIVQERGGLGGSIDSTFRSVPFTQKQGPPSHKTRNWLLVGFFVFVPLVLGAAFLLKNMRYFLARLKVEEENDEEDYDTTEGSKSEGADQSETASL